LIVLEAINRPTIGKDTRTMSKDSLMEQKRPETIADDPLTKILRQLARKLVVQGPEAEIEHHGIDLPHKTNEKVFNSKIP
jgi:hypothetical protein